LVVVVVVVVVAGVVCFSVRVDECAGVAAGGRVTPHNHGARGTAIAPFKQQFTGQVRHVSAGRAPSMRACPAAQHSARTSAIAPGDLGAATAANPSGGEVVRWGLRMARAMH
jgi:hypothetical protein